MTEYEKHKEDLAFEHGLINRRLTWLLSSQSILFAALAIVLDKESISDRLTLFFNVIPLLGMLISSLIFIGVVMGVMAKVTTNIDYNRGRQEAEKKPLGVRTWITSIALAPDILMPVVFVFAWWWIWKDRGGQLNDYLTTKINTTMKFGISEAIAVAAFLFSLITFLYSEKRAKKAEKTAAKALDLQRLLGEKEEVAFAALKLLREKLPKNEKERGEIITAIIQACIFERSDRTRAFLYRVISENLTDNRKTFVEEFKKIEGIFNEAQIRGLIAEEDLAKNAKPRLEALGKLILIQAQT